MNEANVSARQADLSDQRAGILRGLFGVIDWLMVVDSVAQQRSLQKQN